nr:lachesin-like [Onthophagus taurus]
MDSNPGVEPQWLSCFGVGFGLVSMFKLQVPPDIMDNDNSGDLSISEGDNATLWCRATGHPTPRISWKREDNQPFIIRKSPREFTKVDNYSGSNLYFWKLDRRQMGAYLCIASNDVPPAVSKRVALNINFAPMIKVPNQLLGAPLTTNVQLECYVEAYPNTINYWVKNRGEMLLNGSKYYIREDKNSYKVFMWMTIVRFSEDDIGTYNCISTNSLGKAEGTLRLYEIKVSPEEARENRMSILGGLAEPARGQRATAYACGRRLKASVFLISGVFVVAASFCADLR